MTWKGGAAPSGLVGTGWLGMLQADSLGGLSA